MKSETGPLYTGGKERPKKQPDHSGLAGGRFNKQGSLQMSLVLGAERQVDLCIQWPEF